MKYTIVFITFLYVLPLYLHANNEAFIVKASDVAEHAMTIIPSAHGAVFVATPYDKSVSIRFLEKSGIPPQFNGLKRESNPNDPWLPQAPVSSPRISTPNPSFSTMSERQNLQKKHTSKKGVLKDITHD